MHSVPNIKTHAHTMDNLSKVLCMCQNPFDTRKFTSLVPNCYFFVSLPGQTCCFRGVKNFYVKLTKQFTKKFEFTIIHFPCPVKCTNHLPQDPSILYIWCCVNPWIEREGVWHPSDNVCLLDLDFDPSQLLDSTSSAKLSPHIGSHQIGNRRGEQLKCTSPPIRGEGGGVITLKILNSYCHNIICGSLYRTRLQMERQNNSKPSSWKNKQMWGC